MDATLNIVLALCMCFLTTVSCEECPRLPRGVFRSVLDSTCFGFFERPADYQQAEDVCRRFGGHLASIHSKTLNERLVRIMHFVCPHMRHAWIGLNDRDDEAQFRWTDGSRVDFTNWKEGPRSGPRCGSDEHRADHCAALSALDTTWKKFRCRSHFFGWFGPTKPFICEFGIPALNHDLFPPITVSSVGQGRSSHLTDVHVPAVTSVGLGVKQQSNLKISSATVDQSGNTSPAAIIDNVIGPAEPTLNQGIVRPTDNQNTDISPAVPRNNQGTDISPAEPEDKRILKGVLVSSRILNILKDKQNTKQMTPDDKQQPSVSREESANHLDDSKDSFQSQINSNMIKGPGNPKREPNRATSNAVKLQSPRRMINPIRTMRGSSFESIPRSHHGDSIQ